MSCWYHQKPIPAQLHIHLFCVCSMLHLPHSILNDSAFDRGPLNNPGTHQHTKLVRTDCVINTVIKTNRLLGGAPTSVLRLEEMPRPYVGVEGMPAGYSFLVTVIGLFFYRVLLGISLTHRYRAFFRLGKHLWQSGRTNYTTCGDGRIIWEGKLS
jgi:hypothetical protein